MIANVNKLCFLGIQIDGNLALQNHVETVTNNFFKVRENLNKLIKYGSLVRGTNINRIFKTQERGYMNHHAY